MNIPLLPLLFAGFTVICLLAGIWLLLHLTALAAYFRGTAGLVPSPRRPRASRAAIAIALALFGGSLLGVLAMQVAAITA